MIAALFAMFISNTNTCCVCVSVVHSGTTSVFNLDGNKTSSCNGFLSRWFWIKSSSHIIATHWKKKTHTHGILHFIQCLATLSGWRFCYTLLCEILLPMWRLLGGRVKNYQWVKRCLAFLHWYSQNSWCQELQGMRVYHFRPGLVAFFHGSNKLEFDWQLRTYSQFGCIRRRGPDIDFRSCSIVLAACCLRLARADRPSVSETQRESAASLQ